MKSNFREWTLDKIDDAFGLRQVRKLAELDSLLAYEYEINDYEKQYLTDLSDSYYLGGDSWNEVELENKIISPLFVFQKLVTNDFHTF